MNAKHMLFAAVIPVFLATFCPLRGESAASNTEKQKETARASRTLKQTIDRALTNGVNHKLDSYTAKQLGFKGAMTTKMLWYGQAQTSDKYDHYFSVIEASKIGEHPLGLVWTRFKKSENGSYDRRVFFSGLDGKLKTALQGGGRDGTVHQETVSVTSPQLQKEFQAEKDFFSKEALALTENK